MTHPRQTERGGTRPRLLVVDDEWGIAQLVAEVAERAGFEALFTSDPKQFSSLYSPDIDGIIIDLVMPGMDGIELIRSLAEMRYPGALILMSGLDPKVLQCSMELAVESGLRVVGHVTKPIPLSVLKSLLDEICMTDVSPTSAHAKTDISADDLVRSMNSGQILSFYQPKIDLKTGEFAGVEALARLRHPSLGIIGPETFLPVAENAGLMEGLTWVIVDEIFQQIGTWREDGLIPNVSINMAPASFGDLGLPEKLEDRARAVGVSASQISIEVTESGSIADLGQMADSLIRLRVKGIGVSMDDFGTGHSTFTQLRSLPVNELKIDRSFVGAACHDDQARSIVEATINLGHRLGMNVVAEGVETLETVELLRQLGCNDGQGYFFGIPMHGSELGEWLEGLSGKFALPLQRYLTRTR